MAEMLSRFRVENLFGSRTIDIPIVDNRPFFHLTRLGGYVVRRLFHLVEASEDQRCELEFTKMRRMMQNTWEARE